MSSNSPSAPLAGEVPASPTPRPDTEQPEPAFGPPLLETPGAAAYPAPALPPEEGGPSGPEPTRYGDWERKGIAVDF